MEYTHSFLRFFTKTSRLLPPSINTNLSRCLGFGKFQPSCPFVGSFINVYSGNYERKITIIYRGLAWKRCSREGLFLQSRVHQNPKVSPSDPTMGGPQGDTTYVTHTCYYKNNKIIIWPPQQKQSGYGVACNKWVIMYIFS